MSRAPPFPTRRAPSSSQSNGNAPPQTPFPSVARPLQINRPPSRPTTPSSSSLVSESPRGAVQPPSGPSKLQRSELRVRQASENSNSEISSFRDSISTTYSDVPQPYRARNGAPGIPNTPADSRPKLQRLRSGPDDSGLSPITPTMSAVISAFQSAGARKRAATNGSEDTEHEKNRERELQIEKIRQQRIRDKVPGRRMDHKARAGDIDGM
jgi:exocyst complex component 4